MDTAYLEFGARFGASLVEVMAEFASDREDIT